MANTTLNNEEGAQQRSFKGCGPIKNWSSYSRMSHVWEKAVNNPKANALFARHYAHLSSRLVHEPGDRDILHDVFLKMTAEQTPARNFLWRAIYLFKSLKRSYKGDDADSAALFSRIFGEENACKHAEGREKGWSDNITADNGDGGGKDSSQQSSDDGYGTPAFCFMLLRRCA